MLLAVGANVRRRLMGRMQMLDMDTTGMRSFLDPPARQGKTRNGSGEVGYIAGTRNSHRLRLSLNLRIATATHLETKLEAYCSLRISLRNRLIPRQVCISGR